MAEVTPKFKKLPLNDDGSLIKNGFNIKSPRQLVIVKYPKSGSTLACGNVPKILIADSEHGTDTFELDNVANLIDPDVEGKFKETKQFGWIPQTLHEMVSELYIANKMKEFWILYNLLQEERNLTIKEKYYNQLIELFDKMPFPIVNMDTITALVGISNQAALYEYNLKMKPENRKIDIKKADDYGGVRFIRSKFNEVKRFIEQMAAPFIIYSGHVGLKKKVLSKSEEDVNALDIALEGVLSVIFTSQANAVCTFKRESTGCYLDFLKQDESDLGSRNLHLSNRKLKIVESASDEDMLNHVFPLKHHWDIVYPEISFS